MEIKLTRTAVYDRLIKISKIVTPLPPRKERGTKAEVIFTNAKFS
jgi:hypothetical protein